MYTNAFHKGSTFYVRTLEGNFKFRPSVKLYTEDKNGTFTSLEGKKLVEREFDTIKEAKDYIKSYKDIFQIYGQENFDLQIINDEYGDAEPIDFNDLIVFSIDIEVNVPTGEGFPEPMKAAWPVDAITITDRNRGKIYSFGLGPWSAKKAVERGELSAEVAEKVSYRNCVDEIDLLHSLITLFSYRAPHILTGWHSEGFDMPYLYNRIMKLLPGMQASLSPWNQAYTREFEKFGSTSLKVNYRGIAQLDYKDLYEKFTFKKRDSYKLNNIAYVELGEEKLSYEEEKSLYTLAANNFQKYISYNILDAVLVDRLDEKLNLLGMVVDVANIAKINYEDVFSPVKIWDALAVNRMLKKQQIPKICSPKDRMEYPGGYFKEPIPNLYKWIISFDLKSLYPSIIQQWNIGLETLIQGVEEDISEDMAYGNFQDTSYLKERNTCLAGNGIEFSTEEQSFLSEIHEELMYLRGLAKDEKIVYENKKEKATNKEDKDRYEMLQSKWNTRNLALKVISNAGYGALGNQYYRFNNWQLASAITLSGQAVIKFAEHKVNEWLNNKLGTDKDYCTAIATDSIYFTIEDYIKPMLTGDDKKDVDLCDEICKQIESEVLEPAFQEFFERFNCYSQKMFMDREVIAKVGFWQAKQNYALDVYDKEGVRYKKPKLKIMGLSMIKSSTPEWCRDKMEDALKIMLREDAPDRMSKYFNKCEQEFKKLPVEDVAFNVRCGDYNKYYSRDDHYYYKKGAQIQIKGMLLHNKILKDLNIKDIPPLMSGEMVKYAYLKRPHPYQHPDPKQSESIAFDTFLDDRFDLRDYVCYDTQFQKAFKKALTDICDNIGVGYADTVSLNSIFG